MKRTSLLTVAAALALMPGVATLTACASGPASSRPADLTFAQMAPLQLNVGAVDVINNTPTSQNPRVKPGLALENYAHRRLKAMGGEGVLNFIVQQATLTSGEQESTGHWSETFQLSKPMEYTVTMRVGLNLTGRTSAPNTRSAFTLERKKTMPAGASLADRDNALNRMIEDMVRDVDTAVQRGLNENMRILVTPGAVTFGTPEPLETTGAIVTPGPANAQPIVIQGTLD